MRERGLYDLYPYDVRLVVEKQFQTEVGVHVLKSALYYATGGSMEQMLYVLPIIAADQEAEVIQADY